MLHLGDQDLVARLQLGRRKALGHDVDRLGGVAREDDLAPVAGIDEMLDLAPRLVVQGRSALAQIVDAAMDIGVVRLVDMAQRVDDRARLLRRGGTVEIDQRLALHLGLQDRELGPDRFDVEAQRAVALIEGGGVAHSISVRLAAPGVRAIKYSCASLTTVGSANRSMTSAAKA